MNIKHAGFEYLKPITYLVIKAGTHGRDDGNLVSSHVLNFTNLANNGARHLSVVAASTNTA